MIDQSIFQKLFELILSKKIKNKKCSLINVLDLKSILLNLKKESESIKEVSIYEVTEKKTGKLYAAKIIDCNDDEDQCKKMVNRELSVMLSTNHPTIIKLVGYSLIDFHDEHNITIIMN